tara:strand:+ start:1442 stop:2674 length:1233 start_codon:yes stop_codon:yes gene_type:complete
MSSNNMLKQAIIDANVLREVALKNAEAIVVEKYSNQIKEAVDTMLEQEEELLEPEMGAMETDADTLEMADAPSGIDDQVTLAAVDGERLCPCPDDKKTVEINFDQLQDMMQQLEDGPEGAAEMEIEDAETLPQPTPGEILDDDEDEEMMFELDDLLKEVDNMGMPEDVESQEAEEHAAELDEDEDREEEVVHYDDAAKDDWAHIKALAKDAHDDRDRRDDGEEGEEDRDRHRDAAEDDYAHIRDLKRDATDDHHERERYMESLRQTKKILKENTSLAKTNSKMLTESKQLLQENTDLKSLLKKLSGTLEEVNLSNAKLIYTNQVLNSASLNERQKQRIVESLNGADSVEAAKSIYETLQSAVGSSLKSRDKPQSLGEAIVRGKATMLRQKQEKTTQDPHINRMKKLAGIN